MISGGLSEFIGFPVMLEKPSAAYLIILWIFKRLTFKREYSGERKLFLMSLRAKRSNLATNNQMARDRHGRQKLPRDDIAKVF
jgi:hypothetical protein